MTLAQQTRNASYALIEPSLMPKQKAVYDMIVKQGSISNRLLSTRLSLAINSTVPRVNELVKLGFVEASHIAYDEVTKRRVIFWKVKSSDVQLKML